MIDYIWEEHQEGASDPTYSIFASLRPTTFKPRAASEPNPTIYNVCTEQTFAVDEARGETQSFVNEFIYANIYVKINKSE